MKFNVPQQHMEELYYFSKEPYVPREFNTIHRNFTVDPLLVNPKKEFKLDTTWCEHPELSQANLHSV